MGRLRFYVVAAVILLVLQANSVSATGPSPPFFDLSFPSATPKTANCVGFFQIAQPCFLAQSKPASAIQWTAGDFKPISQTDDLFCPLSCRETFLRVGNRARNNLFNDFKHFYRRDTLANYGVVLLGAGALANSKMDGNFQDWYRGHVRSDFTDGLSDVVRVFGDGDIFIPLMVTSAVLCRFQQERLGKTSKQRDLGNFVARTARGYVTGTPLLLTTQVVLGGNRPAHGQSYWKPFSGEDHTASGHAYVGAVPFITAAQMSDNFWAKSAFYTLSALPAWSRVNDDSHYLSQSILGWYLAYLSVRAVSETENQRRLPKGLTIFPVVESNGGVGIGFSLRR